MPVLGEGADCPAGRISRGKPVRHPELVELAKSPGKHVILIAGPSPSSRNKAKALRPLMVGPTLRVFNHLTTEVPTAKDLLRT